MSTNVERVIKSQARATSVTEYSYKSHRVFEHDPRHLFIIKINDKVTPDEDSEEYFKTSQIAEILACLIHDTAVLNSRHNNNELVSILSLSFAFRPYSCFLISCYDFFRCSVTESEMGVDDLGLEDEIEPSIKDDILEDEEESERME